MDPYSQFKDPHPYPDPTHILAIVKQPKLFNTGTLHYRKSFHQIYFSVDKATKEKICAKKLSMYIFLCKLSYKKIRHRNINLTALYF